MKTASVPARAAKNFTSTKSTRAEEPDAAAIFVPITHIVRWSGNPRTEFDQADLQLLADSLRLHGVLSPLTVRPFPQDEEMDGPRYQIIAGERRYRAAQLAGLTSLPCVVRDVDNAEAHLMAVAENDVRVDLNPLDRASAYVTLQTQGWNQTQIGEKLGRSQAYVSAHMRLLQFPKRVQDLIRSEQLSVGHAKPLHAFRDFPAVVSKIAELAASQNASVRTLEGEELPFSRELATAKVIRQVHRYTTPFDTTVCETCPFGAFRKGKYESYCLNPGHYDALVVEATEHAKAQAIAAREALVAKLTAVGVKPEIAAKVSGRASIGVLVAQDGTAKVFEEKPETPQFLSLYTMNYADYEEIGKYCPAPEGCSEACLCRSKALDHNGKVVSICLDKGRLNSLKGAATRIAQKTRKVVFQEYREKIQTMVLEERYRQTVVLLLIPTFAGICVSVKRDYARLLPPGAFRTILEGDRLAFHGKDAWDTLASMPPYDLFFHCRNLVLRQELFTAYEEKSDGLTQVRFFLGLDKATEPIDDSDPDVPDAGDAGDDFLVKVCYDPEDTYLCMGCHEDIPKDLLGVPFNTETNGVFWLNSKVKVTPDFTYYCPQCAPTTLFCRQCGATGDEDAMFGDGEICTDCLQGKGE